MKVEQRLQSKIINWLKDCGAFVIKTQASPGVPIGSPDVIFLYRDKWGAIEVKASIKAPVRYPQKVQLERLRSYNPYVYLAYPENWDEIKDELYTLFFGLS